MDDVQQNKRIRRKTKKFWYLLVLLILIAASVIGFWIYQQKNDSVVPREIQKAVGFPVYYPDQSKLPAGYKLDGHSFKNPVKNGVAYTVNGPKAQKMVFSVQPRPSDNELQSFYGSYMPLKIDVQTPNGQAEIGAYHQKTLVSLPIINGPWIIITAPGDMNQGQLKQILYSIKKN